MCVLGGFRGGVQFRMLLSENNRKTQLKQVYQCPHQDVWTKGSSEALSLMFQWYYQRPIGFSAALQHVLMFQFLEVCHNLGLTSDLDFPLSM